jgi:hypothetical protein
VLSKTDDVTEKDLDQALKELDDNDGLEGAKKPLLKHADSYFEELRHPNEVQDKVDGNEIQ